MEQTPTFINPPIVEFVLGAQFAPLGSFTSAHFGRFWDRLGSDWIDPRDNPLIEDQFERFDQVASPRKWRLRVEPAPLVNRLTLINRKGDRLLQLQPTRFHMNWRKTDELKPSYKELIEEFESEFGKFVSFCDEVGVGTVEVNQWELTYVDFFPKGEYWETPEDWNRFLPGLFRDQPPAIVEPLRFERRDVQWTMEIEPKLGRLHLTAGIGNWKDEPKEGLTLSMTARGPLVPEWTPTLRDGLDLGHGVAVRQFLKMVDEDTKTSWGVK
ncbi:MAG: TIGR04255 family protein [Pirellulaceae bacterium]|nr:TIGR04255 family protein [Pirellulaceae bacterium]